MRTATRTSADPRLHIGKGATMRYVRAAVVLLAAMTFSHDSYGQSRHPTAVVVAPFGSAARPAQPGAVPPAQNTGATCTIGSVCAQLPRYNDTPIYGIAEYDVDTCQQTSPGKWTGFPSETVLKQPISTGYDVATVTVNCAGGTSKQQYLFAIMCYDWTNHNNHSNPNPSAIPGFPMDTFAATWEDKPGAAAGECNPQQGPGTGWTPSGTGPFPTPFRVYVQEVIPSGETTQGVGWNQASALFQMTLQCCKPADPTGNFDFSGEEIDEEIQAISDPCALGSPDTSMHPIVQQGNIWQPDSVGWHTCPLAQLWCSQRQCSFVYSQTVSIRNPQADPPRTSVTYSTNIQSSSMAGKIINPAYKYASGTITSTRAHIPAAPRAITLSTGFRAPPGVSLYYCPNLANVPCP